MDACLVCPKGTTCRGYKLHLLILKLYDALRAGAGTDLIVRELTREDMLTMADLGAKAEAACWNKGFVLTVARKVADITGAMPGDAKLRLEIERMIVRMDVLFTKLPHGIAIDLSDLAMEIFNHACANLETSGADAIIPANVVGQACAAVQRKKGKAGAKAG